MMNRFIVTAFLALCAVASANAEDPTTPSRARAPTTEATKGGNAVSYQLFLKSDHSESEIEAAFTARAAPQSQQFRQHLSLIELQGLVGASSSTIASAQKVLRENGVSGCTLSQTRDVLFCPSAPTREELMGHPLFQKPNPISGGNESPVVKAELAVPAVLAPFVKRVLHVRTSGHPHKTLPRFAKSTSAHNQRHRGGEGEVGAASQWAGMTQNPFTIQKRYKLPNTTLTVPSNFSQAVAEFEQEQFQPEALVTFNKRWGAGPPEVRVVGPNNGGYFGEGTLDLEYINILAVGVPVYWVAENYFDLVSWVDKVLAIPHPPKVLSVSWGSGSSGFALASKVADNEAFRKLALMGFTVLVAAGDQGTGSVGFFTCKKFDPTWPASSPYVTTVGGTYSQNTNTPEVGWSFGGGGFSPDFERPAWQDAAVAKYLALGKPSSSSSSSAQTSPIPDHKFFNSTGRAFPDISAVATNFEVFSGAWGKVSGTSAATPTIAAIITRINAERVNVGHPLVGFLNHALYAGAAANDGTVGFDVTVGNNKQSPCPQGFGAAAGWDAITGLGTPVYETLKSILS